MTFKRRESTAQQAYTNGHGVAAFFAPKADTSDLAPTAGVPAFTSPDSLFSLSGAAGASGYYLVPLNYKKYRICFSSSA
jgi:hypothetical protein